MLKTKLLVGALALIFSVCATSIHADVILVQEDFGGAATSNLNGTTPTIGTGSWVSQTTSFNADGSTLMAGNSLAYLSLGNVVNSAKGTPDGLFELTATLDHPSAGSWYSLGFSQQTAPTTNNHFLNRDGLGTIILRTSGELDMWAGNGFTPNGSSPSGNDHAIDGPNSTAGPRILTVEMDLRTWDGSSDFGTVTFFDSVLGNLGSHAYTDFANPNNQGGTNTETDPVFSSIMLSGSGNTVGAYSSLTLTQITEPVPEPGSLALLGLGSLVMVTRRRRN